MKIYIIEDDANILSSLQAKFAVIGFQTVSDLGLESIEHTVLKVKESRPDLVVLDLILPKIDGFELVNAVKSDKELCHLPVFAFTNLSDNGSRARGFDLGLEQYLVKSELNPEEFVMKVKKIFENKEKKN